MGIQDTMTRLYAEAHRLGDDYYKLASFRIRTNGHLDDDCRTAADRYLSALTELRSHLDSAEQTGDIQQLRESTAKYIDILNEEIMRYSSPASDTHRHAAMND